MTTRSFEMPDSARHMMDQVRQQHRYNNPVLDVADALQQYISDFQAGLDPEHEIGVQLASFGGVIFFHAEKISFYKPNVISFEGVTGDGERVQLVQHVSQLNFLLKAARKQGEKPRRIGFVLEGE